LPEPSLRGGGLELAVELVDQGLAVLVALLVLADLADLGGRETVDALGDLGDVLLVVVGDGERRAVDLTLDDP